MDEDSIGNKRRVQVFVTSNCSKSDIQDHQGRIKAAKGFLDDQRSWLAAGSYHNVELLRGVKGLLVPCVVTVQVYAVDFATYRLGSSDRGGGSSTDPSFGDHVDQLRGTMFYVCQGSCLCGTVNNRGKVIYCYGDLVPRQGELFAEGSESGGKTSSKDLLAAQLGVWTFGIIAL